MSISAVGQDIVGEGGGDGGRVGRQILDSRADEKRKIRTSILTMPAQIDPTWIESCTARSGIMSHKEKVGLTGALPETCCRLSELTA